MPTERRLNSVRPFATIASLALAIVRNIRTIIIKEGARDRIYTSETQTGCGQRNFSFQREEEDGGSIIERRRRRRKTTRSHLHGGTTKVAEVKLTSRAQRAKIIDNYRRASSPTIYMYANPPQFTASLPRAVVRFFRRTGAASRSSFRGNDSIPILVSATIVPRNHPMIYGTVRRKPRTGCQQTKLIRIVASRPIMLDN